MEIRITSEIVKENLREYGLYVIEDRAIADVRDGLKPVQRRALWSLHTLGRHSKAIPVKCATVVGDCFVAGALVSTERGLVPIENVQIGDKVLTPYGDTTEVVRTFANPPLETVLVRLANGKAFRVTPGQKFMVLSSDTLLTQWKKAAELTPTDLILTVGWRDDRLSVQPGTDAINARAYCTGLYSAEGSAGEKNSSRVSISMTDKEPLLFLERCLQKEGLNPRLSTRKAKNNKWSDQYTIRVSCCAWAHEVALPYSWNKNVPSWILCNRDLFVSWVAGYFDGDGHVRTQRGSREITFASTSYKLLYSVQTMLTNFGVHGTCTVVRDGTEQWYKRTWHNGYALTYTGVNAKRLGQLLVDHVHTPKKKQHLVSLCKATQRELNTNSECFPGGTVFAELSKYHLGAGWYVDTNGKKFRAGIKYPGGSKLRYEKNLRDKDLSYRQLQQLGIQDKLERIGSTLAPRLRHLMDNFSIVKVEAVEKDAKYVATYDIQVADKKHAILVDGCVVHNCIGKYHPHGDTACYGAIVTMAWLRCPLVKKEGNFGTRISLQDANAAAYRYTETRLTEFADRIFDDINVMPMVKSFTEEHDEPFLLPTRIPLLLVNGCAGVAVGMATNIPPHNVGEVLNATLEVLENPNCTNEDLLKHIKGPDYGAGVLLSKKADLLALYSTGQGKLSFSCNYHFEEGTRGKQRLVITGFCPGFNGAKLLEETQKLADAKLLDRVANDEGSKKIGVRVVIDFSDPKIVNDRVLPLLQSSHTYKFFALDAKKRPHLYNLKSLLEVFIKFRRKIEKLVLEADLEATRRKLLIEQARLIAIDNLKIVLGILNEAESTEAAAEQLQKKLSINEEQATIILDTAVKQLLRKVNRDSVLEKIAGLEKKINDIKTDLEDIDAVVGRRLREMLAYADARGTRLRGGKDDLDTSIATANYYVGVTEQGKIDSSNEAPIRSKAAWQYAGFVCTQNKFAVVSDDNVGQSVSLSFLDKFDRSVGRILGAASDQDDAMLVVSKSGRYVAFPPDQRRTQFMVFKELGDDTLLFAGGVGQNDHVAITFTNDESLILKFEDFKITRPNVAPKPIPELGKRKWEVARVSVIPDGAMPVSASGEELGEAEYHDVAFCVGERNLVVRADGKRSIEDQESALDSIENSDVKAVVPIPTEA